MVFLLKIIYAANINEKGCRELRNLAKLKIGFAESGWRKVKPLSINIIKMLEAAKTTLVSNLIDGFCTGFKQNAGVLKSYLRKVLIRCNLHHGLKYSAKVEKAHAAMLCYITQADFFIKVLDQIIFGIFNRGKMKALYGTGKF